MLMSFPLIFYEARNIFLFFIGKRFPHFLTNPLELNESLLKQSVSMKIDKIEDEIVIELDPDRELKVTLKNVFIFLLLCGIVLLSIFIPSIRSVFSVVGVTAGNLVAFILPGAFYL